MRERRARTDSILWLAAVACLGVTLLAVASAAQQQGAATPPPPNSSAGEQRERSIRVDVDLVLVPVTVLDPGGRLVTGLERHHFRIYEEGQEQEILHLSTEEAPISVGLVLDTSGSMSSQMSDAQRAALQFFRTANPRDEFFLVEFNTRARMVSNFTTGLEPLQSRVMYSRARGNTALFDAVYLALDEMRRARNTRRAVLIISDGAENHSRYNENDIRRALREADLQFYAIGQFDRVGRDILSHMANLTGGRLFGTQFLENTANRIWSELRNQYVIAYRPANTQRDGKWRKVKIKLDVPRGMPDLQVFAKSGYYAPK
ncbi:MAG TPA: VWA domain-containing protein [Candidatus Acidoferrales bacterium]